MSFNTNTDYTYTTTSYGQSNAQITFSLLSDSAVLPVRAYDTDAGFDLAADAPFSIRPNERVLVGTGVSCAIPDGHVGLVCPRSGLALKQGVTVLNAPGIIDSSYRGELKVILYNSDTCSHDFLAGDRIAQLVVTTFVANHVISTSLPSAARGSNGFGSSGK